MRGHITERRPGVWRLTVSDGFDEAGQRRRVTRTVTGSKRDAQRELTVMLRERDKGTLADGRQPLEGYLFEEWLPTVSSVSKRGRALAPTTRQRYRDACRHVSEVIGKVRLDELRPVHVEKVRDRLLADRLAPQTVSDVLRVLSQALSRAESLGYVGKNVAAAGLVNRPTGLKPKFATIDAKLGARILDAVRGTDPWDVSAHLSLGLSLRREEVLGLRWVDVDDDVLRVRQTLTYAAGTYHVGPPKSDAGERDLPLPAFVARALKRHRAAQAERLLALGIVPELVVDNGIGEPWMPASFSTGWRRFANAHEFEGITFHTLRHGAATLLLAGGVADAVAIKLMGHADTKILRRYQEVVDELQRDAAARMDQLLGGI
jgi:integrase